MARLKIEFPAFTAFRCSIPVRISDINYGGHAGNDSVLSIIHEARVQYLRSLGYTELSFAGTGLIMSAVQLVFKAELFYGDIVSASITAAEIGNTGFELLYKLEKPGAAPGDPAVLVALAQTSMLCYDYEKKKISRLPDEPKKKLMKYNGNADDAD